MVTYEVEQLVGEIGTLGAAQGDSRDALTIFPGRLHLARGPGGRLELFIEGPLKSFGPGAVGRSLEFGEFREVRGRRSFEAVVVHAPAGREWVRPMAHLAYEAVAILALSPDTKNEDLLARLEHYLRLVSERRTLSVQNQMGLAGELTLMLELLNQADRLGLSASAAVDAWTGWDSASRDFIGDGVAVEVKTAGSVDRSHWVHPMYQLLAAPGEVERVYVFSLGLRPDKSRLYRLLSIVEKVLDRLPESLRERFLRDLGSYGGVGFDMSLRPQYELETGFLPVNTPSLVRVDHLTDILRPGSFSEGRPPGRVKDLHYRVSLEGLPVADAEEREWVLGRLLRVGSPDG